MAIKTTQLKTAIFIASLTAASHPALAYDAFTESGAIPTEIHNWQTTSPPMGDPNCGTLCLILGGQFELNYIMRVENITAGFTGGVANAMIDNYVGAQGVASSGTLPIFLHFDQYITIPDQDYLSTYNPAISDSAQSWVPSYWDFTTSVEGKISSGYIMVKDTQDGPLYIYDFTERVEVALSPCMDENGSPPSITSVRAVDPSNLAATLPPTGCLSFEYRAPLAYLTCDTRDECGQFGKSVPMPALAAGMLSLGLLGIALFTRRQT